MITPVLTCNNEEFIFKCSFQDRFLARKAGLYFDPHRKLWCTTSKAAAARLCEFADDNAKKKLSSFTITVSPWSKPLPAPPDGLTLYPHQIDAIHFALARNRCYLGLDPGLGKTIVAAMISKALKVKVIYVCPPFLVQNTIDEFTKWTPDTLILVLPDSMLSSPKTKKVIDLWLLDEKPTILFVDEAHRFKNMDAQRTKALLGFKGKGGIVDLFDKHVFMSGTPMPNRPFELYPILRKEAHETIGFMTAIEFGERYCGAYHNGFGWNFAGASNVPELAKKVIHPTGPYMLRQKKDILDLPPLMEEVFVVSENPPKALLEFEQDLKSIKPEDVLNGRITILAEEEGKDPEALHLGTYRRLLGMAKVKPSVDYIKSILEDGNESILVYAYHKQVIAELKEALKEYDPYVITGDTPVKVRHNMVKCFQENETRVFIGNYAAMGVGFTLTKATRVISVEFDWVPGVNSQARDRTHRIGQEKSVLHQFIVYKDSFDKVVLETLMRKMKSIKHI